MTDSSFPSSWLNFSRAHTNSFHLLPSFLSHFCSLSPTCLPKITLSEVETFEDLAQPSSALPPHLSGVELCSLPSPLVAAWQWVSYLGIRIIFFFFLSLLNQDFLFPPFSSAFRMDHMLFQGSLLGFVLFMSVASEMPSTEQSPNSPGESPPRFWAPVPYFRYLLKLSM